MHKKAVKQLTLAIAAGFVFAGVLLATLTFLDIGPFGHSSASALGWMIPVVAGAVIGIVAFLLLDTDQADTGSSVGLKATVCESCGAEVIEEWRMCPDCGEMLDESARAEPREYRPRAIL